MRLRTKADEEATTEGIQYNSEDEDDEDDNNEEEDTEKKTRNCSISLTVSDVRISSEKRPTYTSTLRIVRIYRLPMISYDVYLL